MILAAHPCSDATRAARGAQRCPSTQGAHVASLFTQRRRCYRSHIAPIILLCCTIAVPAFRPLSLNREVDLRPAPRACPSFYYFFFLAVFIIFFYQRLLTNCNAINESNIFQLCVRVFFVLSLSRARMVYYIQ